MKALGLELVEGETLQEQIARGWIPVDEALKIALQICEGLEAVHEKGIIHRGLEPANIKITPEGQVKILDSGLAKALEAEVPVSEIAIRDADRVDSEGLPNPKVTVPTQPGCQSPGSII